MRRYGQDGRIEETLRDLETTLEAYLGAWRREFGMGEGARAISDAEDLGTYAGRATDAERMM
jgi:hypothetical protein